MAEDAIRLVHEDSSQALGFAASLQRILSKDTVAFSHLPSSLNRLETDKLLYLLDCALARQLRSVFKSFHVIIGSLPDQS